MPHGTLGTRFLGWLAEGKVTGPLTHEDRHSKKDSSPIPRKHSCQAGPEVAFGVRLARHSRRVRVPMDTIQERYREVQLLLVLLNILLAIIPAP